ncbi:unnamed protein product [Victoria cruziana]
MDYLAEIKIVCDPLAAVESPVSDREQVHHILCTPGPKYNIFCIVLQVLPVLSTLHELKTKLLQHEVQNFDVIVDNTHAVLYSQAPGGVQREMPNMNAMNLGRGRAENNGGKGILPTQDRDVRRFLPLVFSATKEDILRRTVGTTV